MIRQKKVKLFNKKFFGLTPFLFFLCLILMLPVIVQAASVTMTWDRNREPDIAGYKIFYGTHSEQYTNSITIYDSANQPLQRSYTVAGLSEGTTYYSALKTFDQAGQESGYSNEISQNIPGGGDGGDTTAGRSLSIYSAPTTIGEHGQSWPDDMLPPVDENTVAVTSVDIDGDGIDEIAYLKKGPRNEQNFDLYIYSAPTMKGQRGVYLASDYWTPDGNTIGMAAIDIDGDGIDEIAYLKQN